MSRRKGDTRPVLFSRKLLVALNTIIEIESEDFIPLVAECYLRQEQDKTATTEELTTVCSSLYADLVTRASLFRMLLQRDLRVTLDSDGQLLYRLAEETKPCHTPTETENVDCTGTDPNTGSTPSIEIKTP